MVHGRLPLTKWMRGSAIGVLLCAGAAVAEPTMERQVIGTSPAGEPVVVWTLADQSSASHSADMQPAIAILAGVQGNHQIGAHVAEAIGRLLLNDYREALSGRTVYIVPRVNPEGLKRFASADEATVLSGRAPESRDADRDRRVDEDPPNDLNGDGMITMMRVPAPNTAFGLEATHVIDPDDPRIVREPSDDEGATHAMLIEGLDDDGDGRFNEDGWGGASGGGIDLDMHFPMHWPEHADGAGRFPLDRPEARGIVEWLQSRGNIAAVIVFGPHDTITSVPPTGRFGPDGRTPKGIEEDDAAAYAMVSEVFEDITGISRTEDGPSRGGSLVQWCYADLGVYTFGTPVWVRPDLVKQDNVEPGAESSVDDSAPVEEGPTPEDVEAADRADLADRGVGQMFIDFLYMSDAERAGVQAQIASMDDAELQDLMQQFALLPADVQSRLTAVRGGNADPGPSDDVLASIGSGDGTDAAGRPSATSSPDSADAKWLAWIDERGIEGFVAWQTFDHPQLGAVEIGGFVPGVRVNPPEEDHGRLAAQQAEFAAALLGMLPSVELDGPTVERVGGGLWRVGVTLRNTGELPTKSAMGIKARRLPGIICVLDPDQALPTDHVVTGSRVVRVASIDGRGGSERAEWLIVAEEGDVVDLEIRSPMFGTTRYPLKMEAE